MTVKELIDKLQQSIDVEPVDDRFIIITTTIK